MNMLGACSSSCVRSGDFGDGQNIGNNTVIPLRSFSLPVAFLYFPVHAG